MELKLDDKQIENMVSEALLQTIDNDKRDVLIKSAITSLITKKQQYSDKTILEEQFQKAVYVSSQKLLNQMMEDNEEFQNELRKIMTDVLMKLFDNDNREKLVEKMANQISKAISDLRDY